MSALDEVELTLITSLEDVMSLFRWLGERRPVHALGADSETTGLNPMKDKVRLGQVGDNRHGWAFDADKWSGILEDLVHRWDGDWVLHNAPFDTLSFEQSRGIIFPRHKIHDTMVQSRINESHMSMALKSQSARHVDPAAAGLQEVLKGTNFTWETVPIRYGPYWQYGALDPVLTYCLDMHHRPLVQEEAPLAYEIEMSVLWVVEKMRRNGACIDRKWVLDHFEKFNGYIAQVEQWVGVNYGVKPGSNAAIVKILSDAGYQFSKATKSGAVSLDAEVLESIDHPLAQAVLGRRQAQKMSSTYLKFYLLETSDAHPFVHPSFNTLGARTSRMSCDSPNLQNVPRLGTSKFADAVRNCVVSRHIAPELLVKFDVEGFTQRDAVAYGCLIFCDFSQIEMRILAHLAKEQAMIDAFLSDEDFFVALARQIYQDDSIGKKDPRRRITKNCVPLNTQILTRRGWLKHDEVQIGDETLGVDPTTRTARWTRITAVHHYDDAEVFRLGNRQKSFETTAEHRWLAEHERTHELRFITSVEQPNSVYKLLLAAEAEGGSADITPHEAAVLGWVLSDGSITRGEFTGARVQGRDGRKVKCTLSIEQSKIHRIVEIDQLLTNVPHKRYERTRDGKTGVSWSIAAEWGRSVLERANIHDKQTFDPWQVALSLSAQARHAMIDALNAGDGGSFKHGGIMITQLNGCPVAELVVALGYLTGHFPQTYVREPTGEGWTRSTRVMVSYEKPHMTGQRSQLTLVGEQDVWCVTTELGTWTARQGRVPFITGNSGYAKIYGAGVRKFAQTAGISESQAREFLQRFDMLYPGVRRWQQDIITQASYTLAEYGQGFVRSPLTNRRYVGDPGKEYALGNYQIQGSAAEINKMKLIELDNAGLGDVMFGTVHDEVLLDVPGPRVLDTVDILRKVMNDSTLLTVPIEAEISFGHRWGRKQDWKDE